MRGGFRGPAAARFLGPEEGPDFQSLADRAAREYGRSEPVGNRYLKEGLPDNTTARALVQALVSGRRHLAEGLLNSEIQKGTAVPRLHLELFQPSLRGIGRLAAKAAEWNAASGRPWKVEFSAGYSVFSPESRESLGSLVARADSGMYAAKKQGKGPPQA